MFRKLQYIYNELAENYDNGYWWRNRIAHRICGPLQEQIYGRDGIDVPSRDWDNLLLLDSCRSDYFEEVANLERFDEYRVVESKGSATPEWLRQNFVGEEFGDIVYVNANPHVSREAPDCFHKIIDVWQEDYNEERGTVMAEDLGRHARRAIQEYPNKRIIVHYNQPHGPYVGDVPLKFDKNKAKGAGEALEKGIVTEDGFRSAYLSNLEYVLPHVYDLLEDISGKSIVTADHGELFGKRLKPIPIRAYAHPLGLRDPDLVNVPWAIKQGKRREITDDGVNVKEPVDESIRTERLRDMGYLE